MVWPTWPLWPHADAQRRRLLRTSEHHLGRSAAEGTGSGARVDHCGADVGGDSDSPLRERKVRGRQTRRPTANAVLTTVVDTWGRSWTPRCSSRSSDLIRRTVVDSRGPGHSPENRMVTSRWSPVSRRCGPAASRSAAATRLDQAELARCSALPWSARDSPGNCAAVAGRPLHLGYGYAGRQLERHPALHGLTGSDLELTVAELGEVLRDGR
jgi:hypothetical protein